MDNASDELSPTQWVVVIGLFVVLAAPLAVALAWWCKRRYARAVVALQRQTAPSVASAAELAPAHGAPIEPLAIDTIAPDAAAVGDRPDALQQAERVRHRVLLAQGVMGTGLWLSLLLLTLVALTVLAIATDDPIVNESTGVTAWAHLFFWPLLLAPPLLAWAFQAGWRESRVWVGFGVAFAMMAFASIGFSASVFGSEPVPV